MPEKRLVIRTNNGHKEHRYHPPRPVAGEPVNGEIDKESLLEVLVALKNGDLSKRLPSKFTGIDGKIADTFNQIVDRYDLVNRKIQKINLTVGKQGKLKTRLSSDDLSGSWEKTIDSVNLLIDDLVWPTLEADRVIGAIANGDLEPRMETKKNGEPLKGRFLHISRNVNKTADQLESLTSEFSRVVREVGMEGKLGGQARVKGASGAWETLIEDLNQLVLSLTSQVREIGDVASAVAQGDLTQKITTDARGEFLGLKKVVNAMVDRLGSMVSELNRVTGEVNNEGKLGGQAKVKDLSGEWETLTDNVNQLAGNLANQVYNFKEVISAVERGDLSKQVTVNARGEFRELKECINAMVERLSVLVSEISRVTYEIGDEGTFGGQAKIKGASGVWETLTGNVNRLSDNLTTQVRNISEVISAVTNGDLSNKITVDARGEFQELKYSANRMVGILSTFASEITGVTHKIGTEGKLGVRMELKGEAGIWKSMTNSVNQLSENLTEQMRNVSKVTAAMAQGDLTQEITADAEGEMLELKKTINKMVGQLRVVTSEVSRVAQEVGAEGKLGIQAEVGEVSGNWKKLTDNINLLARNITVHLRDMSKVLTATAHGDLSKKITVDAQGEILELKKTINTMVDMMENYTSEVTRVTLEVGTQGELGGYANVPSISGAWERSIGSLNQLAGNLTAQLRDISMVTTAVARGDLSKKVTVDAQGEILHIKETINKMNGTLDTFASEVTRVTRNVGIKGELGVQADVPGATGTWEALTDNVNRLAGNLTVQLRDISKVATAVAQGDLTKKITVDAHGEILEIKETINSMVDQLGAFSSEVVRVAREMGTQGKLGGQADVPRVSGTWKTLTDNVNQLSGNLTVQLRHISKVATAVAQGDLSKKITVDAQGEILELKETINTMVDQLRSFSSEVTRVAREVGTEGKLGGQARVKGASGTWKDLTDNVNQLASNLTVQLRDVSKVATAIAQGDLGQKITVEAQGEILEIKEAINTMVVRLGSFASEVSRVAREVGIEGQLGGQAKVSGVSGTWKDLTENVNMMASNLTDQVRGIAEIVTAVADGNLTKKLRLEAKGEIASLADTMNNMIDTLATFAEQVTTVAREVGSEGKLGGQADVPGASGTWADLTNNVNQLAENLTTQVRSIAEVATAVTEGDLSRSITIDVSGEVEDLKNNINEMITNLRETTSKNTKQDWLKTNLTKFTRLLQGKKDPVEVARVLLSELAPVVSVQHAVFYRVEQDDESGDESILKLLASYGYREGAKQSKKIRIGEGLIGQCALEKERILLTDIPEDYVRISSGLGEASPLNIAILPVVFEGEVKAVMELASFEKFSDIHLSFFEELTESIGIVLNTIKATMQTENLLEQSQTLASELQGQQEELKQTNEELEEKARMLVQQNADVESKNHQLEYSRQALEEKAKQLQLTSKYKSEFLANMSHELRTPLNSLLVLSEQLKGNADGNLNEKQVEFVETIHAAGTDLLDLINDILDLSKIESGNVSLNPARIKLGDIKEDIKRTFQHMADTKELEFSVEIDNNTPKTLYADEQRLGQVLKNLLSNAFKFTPKGKIELRISSVTKGWTFNSDALNKADSIIAFSVRDTGIGIPAEKQKIIFEAFQQGEGSTSRRFGGTGLGLAISREIAFLLGGELQLSESAMDEGSTFTLFVPQKFSAPAKTERISPENEPDEEVYQKVEAEAAIKENTVQELAEPYSKRRMVLDDRDQLSSGDPVILIIDGDDAFASKLQRIAHGKGYKVLRALEGLEGLAMVLEYRPDAVLFDRNLPDIEGWTLLDRLKFNPDIRHIPVLLFSGDEEYLGLSRGAVSCLEKPGTEKGLKKVFDDLVSFIEQGTRKLLLAEGDKKQQKQMAGLLGSDDIEITVVDTGEKAVRKLKKERFDCSVFSRNLEGMGDFKILEEVKKISSLHYHPVIIYSETELSKEEEAQLDRFSKHLITRCVGSNERLLDETSVFLHRAKEKLPSAKQKMIEKIYEADEVLVGKKVLIVDDDIRNIFALTSVVERREMNVIAAENGSEALKILEKEPDVDIILMDIMMPEMNGYETIRSIREISGFQTLPIFAITAKAMRGDREKCLEAGASDYIAKPVNTEQLLSMMRVWLYK